MINKNSTIQIRTQAPERRVARDAFVNSRGEVVNANLVLTVNPKRGDTWRNWAAATMPVDLFHIGGLVNANGSEDWANLVEHSMFVAAASLTIGRQLQKRGVVVDMTVLERAGWAHDATKRSDVAKAISREDETKEVLLVRLMKEFKYSEAEIAAAKNTGRLADRYLTDPAERMRAITGRSIEENIVGYADARSRGARFASVEDARADSIVAKPNDADFFNDYWAPYYSAVEGYFKAIAPGFDPDAFTDATIFNTIRDSLAATAQ